MLTEVLSFARKADREQFIRDLRDALPGSDLQVDAQTSAYDRRSIRVTIRHERLSVMLHVTGDSYADCPPSLHWHGASDRLAYVRGAWSSVNSFHGHKATTCPRSMIDAIDALRIGFAAVRDGTAFSELTMRARVGGVDYVAVYRERFPSGVAYPHVSVWGGRISEDQPAQWASSRAMLGNPANLVAYIAYAHEKIGCAA